MVFTLMPLKGTDMKQQQKAHIYGQNRNKKPGENVMKTKENTDGNEEKERHNK